MHIQTETLNQMQNQTPDSAPDSDSDSDPNFLLFPNSVTNTLKGSSTGVVVKKTLSALPGSRPARVKNCARHFDV